MNKLILSIISIFIAVGVHANEQDALQQVGYYAMNGDEPVVTSNESEALNIDQNSGKLYEQHMGDDAFLVALPLKNDVHIVINDDVHAMVSVNEEVEYWVIKSKNEIAGLTAEQLFPSYLEHYSQDAYQMLNNEITIEEGLNVLKITCLNQNTGKIEELKIVEKAGKFYVAVKKTPQNQEIKNDHFVQSFAVIN